MRRHVNDVAGARNFRRQMIGIRFRTLRRFRGFHRVDVEVDRVRMPRFHGEGRFQRRDQICYGRLQGLAVLLPVVPRRDVHQRIGIEGLDGRIVGIVPGNLRHGLGVGLIQDGTVVVRIGRVSGVQCLDQGLLQGAGAGTHRHRTVCGLPGPAYGRRVHGRVDIGSENIGLPPGAHGAGRIQLLGVVEGPERFRMVERVRKSQALIEILLRFFVGRGDRKRVVAKVIEQRRRFCAVGSRLVLRRFRELKPALETGHIFVGRLAADSCQQMRRDQASACRSIGG